eukprot:4376936-Pyramimonas_sp.AAC.2
MRPCAVQPEEQYVSDGSDGRRNSSLWMDRMGTVGWEPSQFAVDGLQTTNCEGLTDVARPYKE